MQECENPCPTKESFYKLCDLEETYRLFKDDFVLQVMIAHQKSQNLNLDLQNEEISRFAVTHGIETLIETSETLSETVDRHHRQSALFASCNIIDKVQDFAAKNDRKVLYVLAYPRRYFIKFSSGREERWDKVFIDYLTEKNLPYVDLYEAHMKERSLWNMELSDYLARYFIGHYNPSGNFFFAWQLRNSLLEMLDPKPLPYI
jgi:hypothetical protein